MHCASLLHKIFALLVYTNERVHIHNKRNFRQAKLYIKINVPLLLKEHSDLYFYRIITEYILSSLIKKIIFFITQEKRHSWKRPNICYSGMQIMTVKATIIWRLYVHVILNGVIFWQILCDIVPYARHFLLVKIVPKYYFNKLCSHPL